MRSFSLLLLLTVVLVVSPACEPPEDSTGVPAQPGMEFGNNNGFPGGTNPGGNSSGDGIPADNSTGSESGSGTGSGGVDPIDDGSGTNPGGDVPKESDDPTNNGGTGNSNDETGTTSPPDPNDNETLGVVGDGCTLASDCDGSDAVCLDLPGGYCSVMNCAPGGNTCPEGSVCFSFGDSGSYCLQDCSSSTECRQTEGYVCDVDNTCWPGEDAGGSGGDNTGGSNGTTGGSPVGGACSTNSDCADTGAICYPAFLNDASTGFVDGYCLINDCTPGSCPVGSTCEAIYVNGGTACLASCTTSSDCRYDGGYACYQPGICFPGCGQGSTCPVNWGCDAEISQCVPACTATSCGPDLVCGDSGVCEDPPCTPGSCGTGMLCASNGVCVPDLADGPGPGPGSSCPGLPQRDCTGSASYCGAVIPFNPEEGPGYVNYPLNGETWSNQYRSYARRDLVMLVSWAAAYVDCKAASWGGGNGYPLGLGDMSEANGAIPGTSVGQPGHPANTHEDGYDIDMAYFQNGGSDNYLKAICAHTSSGVDQYHCVGEPYLLDLWRTALYISALQSSTRTRVIGVDGKVGTIVEDAIAVLCANGWVPDGGCESVLAYETTDGGAGWFHFHHHHMHLSLWQMSATSFTDASGQQCLRQDCLDMSEAIDAMADLKVNGHSHEELPPLPSGRNITRP